MKNMITNIRHGVKRLSQEFIRDLSINLRFNNISTNYQYFTLGSYICDKFTVIFTVLRKSDYTDGSEISWDVDSLSGPVGRGT